MKALVKYLQSWLFPATMILLILICIFMTAVVVYVIISAQSEELDAKAVKEYNAWITYTGNPKGLTLEGFKTLKQAGLLEGK